MASLYKKVIGGRRAGLHLSVRQLLAALAGIGETVLI
jgi:hypothetical protein